MKTLLLDAVNWDLVIDSSGNIAVASDPYAPAQDAASAARLFAGELWYNTTLGINYFGLVLGKTPSLPLLKTAWSNAAMRVPGVTAAKSFISSFKDRTVTGQLQITDSAGKTTNLNISQSIPGA